MTWHAEDSVISNIDVSLGKSVRSLPCPATYERERAERSSSQTEWPTRRPSGVNATDISAPEGFPKGYDWEALAEFDDLQSHS